MGGGPTLARSGLLCEEEGRYGSAELRRADDIAELRPGPRFGLVCITGQKPDASKKHRTVPAGLDAMFLSNNKRT